MSTYEKINEQVKNAIASTMPNDSSLKKFNQIKSFLDESLKTAFTKTFSTPEEKSEYLLQVIFQTRDYLISETTENSFRNNLIRVFQQIEEKVIQEEEHQKKTSPENLTQILKDNPEQNQSMQESTDRVSTSQTSL